MIRPWKPERYASVVDVLSNGLMPPAIYRLTHIHHSLDRTIARELAQAFPDSLALLRLKKLRLRVKDRLTTMMRKRISN